VNNQAAHCSGMEKLDGKFTYASLSLGVVFVETKFTTAFDVVACGKNSEGPRSIAPFGSIVEMLEGVFKSKRAKCSVLNNNPKKKKRMQKI